MEERKKMAPATKDFDEVLRRLMNAPANTNPEALNSLGRIYAEHFG